MVESRPVRPQPGRHDGSRWRGDHDFIVIDEVQDLTGVQLALVLACLKAPGQFLLCGDSNQIVHPNFFSWAAVKTLFWKGLAGEAAQRQQLQMLQANFRNTLAVTQLANALLKIKQARFGSIDREQFPGAQYLGRAGDVTLIQAKDAALKQLDTATRASARHAVIVLRDEDKPAARRNYIRPWCSRCMRPRDWSTPTCSC